MKHLTPLALFFLALVSGLVATLPVYALETQEMLTVRIERAKPTLLEFIKDAPIPGYKLTSKKFEAIPEAIRKNLGSVDNTQYNEAYLAANLGSMIALQVKDGNPDFYIIGKDTLTTKYKMVKLDAVKTKNKKLMDKLLAIPGMAPLFEKGSRNLVGALKTVPVKMIRMSEIEFAVKDEVKIESPWGEQTKPAGQDAFLVFDQGKNQYYMVNVDAAGMPISYVPVSK